MDAGLRLSTKIFFEPNQRQVLCIRMSCGTGLLRVASQRLSRPFLKTSTTSSFPDPNDFPWGTENDWISVPSQWFQVLVPCHALQLIPIQTVPKCSTEPIPYATLQLWDQRGAASLRCRNRAKITVLSSYVWTEAISLSDTVFVPVQELSGPSCSKLG